MISSPDSRGWGRIEDVRLATINRPDGVRLPVNRSLVELIAMLLDLTELAGYDLRPGECWGYAKRKIEGSKVWSSHSWGVAVDLNAPTNWRGGIGDIPPKVVDLWTDHGFVWGGTWHHTDPMHFEFGGTPGEAAAVTARLREFLAPAPVPTPAPPTNKDETMRMIIDTRTNIVWLFGCGAPKSLGGKPEEYRRLLALGIPSTEDDGLLIDFLLS